MEVLQVTNNEIETVYLFSLISYIKTYLTFDLV